MPDRPAWRDARQRRENSILTERRRSTIMGERRQKSKLAYHVLYSLLRISGLYAIGARNARATRFREIEFTFADLPPAFDGYTMLHLSDLHIGQPAGLLDGLTDDLSAIATDLVVMTGDYQNSGKPAASTVAAEISRLLAAVDASEGCIAVLGNHDTCDMADALEKLGVRLLINESLEIHRGDDAVRFVGLDDVHSFFTSEAPAALDRYRDGFRIAMVHSVDLAGHAAGNGYRLYLSGHSHGGQVCLPGGKPVFTSLDSHRHLAAGRWRLQDLQGYTNRGLGAQFPVVRFNCPGEVVMIRLRRLPSPEGR